MSHAVQLTVFFAISVALHGVGLWAAAGRFEPRAQEPAAEVAIVDRDLFFRHAERIETQAALPVSASDRLAPVTGDAVRPSQPEDSVLPTPAAAASEPEPERRSPQITGEAMARLDLPTLEPMRPPRRDAVAQDETGVERTEPVRMSGMVADPPVSGTDLRVQRPVSAEPASRARAIEPAIPGRQRIRHAQSVLLASASPADVLRTAAEPAVRGTIDVMDSWQPDPPPVRGLERSLAESAQRMAAVDSARVEPSSPPVAADASEPERVPARDARPVLRGTLRPPLIPPREPEIARRLDAPEQARASVGEVRLRGTRPSETVVGSLRLGPVQAERLAARAAPLAPSRSLSAPGPGTATQATPRRLAARAPPSSRVQATERPTLRGSDPADRFTRTYTGGECFLPVQVASRDGGEIRGYGLEADSLEMFRQAFAQALGSDPDIEWRPLTDAQCGGISFARVVLGGAAPGIDIGLASKKLGFGEPLAGRVTGTEFNFVTLLIIDDSGVVHNVLDYLVSETAELEFSIPVYPVDDGEDRVQLIMAVAASEPLALLESTVPVHSDDFFPDLLAQARETGAALDLGLEDFVILATPR